jgi:hypothetical protein
MSSLTPCAVVVDSRNIRGQAGKMFGWPRQANVDGIRRALIQYGFDVIDVVFGVATRSADNAPSQHLASSLSTNRAYRDRLIADGAGVLEGYLVERKGRAEEKQVDVLCAVKVCDLADRIATNLHKAKCIVVLSEDMDLMPAYEFARERGVPAYAAAFDTIYQRDDQREWLILSEPAMAAAVSPQGRYFGSELRSKLALIATSSEDPKPLTWTVHAPLGDGLFLMRGNLGAPALWKPDREVAIRDKAALFATSLTIHPHEGGRFPHLILSDVRPPQGPMPDVEAATVAYWQSPTSLKVELADASLATVRATPGIALPGQDVAVLRRTSGRDQATYLIGTREPRPVIPGWSAPGAICTATVMGRRSQGWLEGELTDTKERVLIHGGHLDHAAAGTRVVVFASGYLERHNLPTTMPLTCCMP